MEHHRERARPGAALYIGGMGARSKNFYNDIFAQSGYAAEAKQIQICIAAERRGAAALMTILQRFTYWRRRFCSRTFSATRIWCECINSFVGGDASERVQQCEMRNLVDALISWHTNQAFLDCRGDERAVFSEMLPRVKPRAAPVLGESIA